MNEHIDFDRFVADQFAQTSGEVPPARLADDVLIQARRMRPLPRWLATIKEPPMRISSRVAVGSPMARIAAFVISLIILSALTVGGVIGGASLLAAPAVSALGGNGLIAWDSGGDIWVMNPDGTDPRQLTTGPMVERGATWSDDGTKIAYWASQDAVAPDTLVVANADGSDPITIATHEPRVASDVKAERDFDWSPDGRHVAYSLCPVAGDACDRIFVAATDGSGVAQVGDESLAAWRPRWSPDGSLLAFAANRDGVEAGIYLMAPDGSDVRRISAVESDQPYDFFSLWWSPDGTSIATKTQAGLWRIPAGPHDPADELLLVPNETVVQMWSPDGSRIAYIDRADSPSFLAVVPAEGGDPVDLGVASGGYAWAPDGTSIVVQRCASGGCGFDIVDPLTGENIAGADVQTAEGFPSWQRRSQ
jgi:Tol biopolymer transport system component